MYPNPNFLTYFPDAELPEDQGRDARSSCLRIGTWIVIEKLMVESLLDKIISGLYGDDRGVGLFLDLAAYYLTTENNAGQYYPDYACNHPLFTPEYKICSDSTVSTFISQISVEDSVSFQNEWNAVRKKPDKIYISYDSTNKNCQAGDIEIVEFGHVREDRGLPSFNYSIAYDCNNREPLFYESYPGSIVDISQLQLMLNKAVSYGYKNAGFILDRGYFSREDIRYMDHLGYDFVIMVKGMRSFVNDIRVYSRLSRRNGMKGITPQERLEKWNAAICAQKASGLTIKEWCEQNGINSNTYYYYLRRIRDAMLESSGPRLVEMEFPAADLPAGKPAVQNSFLPQITITLRDCVISIGETAPPELISSVLEAVRHA